MATISVDVDVDDIVYSASSYEKKQLLTELLDNMPHSDIISIIKSVVSFQNSANTAVNIMVGSDDKFQEACRKLAINRWRMDLADEHTILRIADKL